MNQNLVWHPTEAEIQATHLYALMQEQGVKTFEEIHWWSVTKPEAFWERTIKVLGIRFCKPYLKILDLSAGVPNAKWLPEAELNIADSCFVGDLKRPAILTRRSNGNIDTITVDALDRLSNRVANGLRALGLGKGDAIAIDMLMTAEAVAAYLGIVKLGAIVVSIPDSFPPDQIAKRLSIGDAKAVFTQDVLVRADKTLPMYQKVCDADAPLTIVLPAQTGIQLRDGDMNWEQFLNPNDQFDAVPCSPKDATNYIFSSGTTGDPKCIPWDHTTPIKSASDALYHHDVRAGDVVCWPTNLGWMMGPWLIYASLLNRATIALYEGAPGERGFCEFVQDAKVTMLGLVPSIVVGWRNTNVAAGLDWSSIRCFSSSGEASNPTDYGWLMGLNQPLGVVKPIIEYCGGTETGGGYVSSHMTSPIEASAFNGKVMGIDFVVLNDEGKPCASGEAGEVFIASPSMGLSTWLHKGDNFKTYYDGCPDGLRRHGDRLFVSENGYKSYGRADNAMNLNGIKIGSTEIEQVANKVPDVLETAAIGVPPAEGGPDRLVIYAVMREGVEVKDLDGLKVQMQKAINLHLNPQFRVFEVKIINALPRTASFKVMHRELRKLSTT